MLLVTDSLEADDIQRNVGLLGTYLHELKKEVSVVSDRGVRICKGELLE